MITAVILLHITLVCGAPKPGADPVSVCRQVQTDYIKHPSMESCLDALKANQQKAPKPGTELCVLVPIGTPT